MSFFLTQILARHVPDVPIEYADIWFTGLVYYIHVQPHHTLFWRAFAERYPHYRRAAFRYYAVRELALGCPEFPTKSDAIKWLVDVLKLKESEWRLLRLSLAVR